MKLKSYACLELLRTNERTQEVLANLQIQSLECVRFSDVCKLGISGYVSLQ